MAGGGGPGTHRVYCLDRGFIYLEDMILKMDIYVMEMDMFVSPVLIYRKE